MSMIHDHETGIALSDSVNKTCVKFPLCGEIQLERQMQFIDLSI